MHEKPDASISEQQAFGASWNSTHPHQLRYHMCVHNTPHRGNNASESLTETGWGSRPNTLPGRAPPDQPAQQCTYLFHLGDPCGAEGKPHPHKNVRSRIPQRQAFLPPLFPPSSLPGK